MRIEVTFPAPDKSNMVSCFEPPDLGAVRCPKVRGLACTWRYRLGSST
jgi:hypothetical protein